MMSIRSLAGVFSLLCLLSGCATSDSGSAASDGKRIYEMRTYHLASGKMEALHQRFRDHTRKLFKKHGIEELGYWVPIDQKDQRLIFILAYPNREARDKSWAAFTSDPEWQAAQKASEVAGRLVEKVEQAFMEPTDYSPRIRTVRTNPPRVFELRTYTASTGNLPGLHSRFRDHTLALFAKHGMTNVAYWNLVPGEKGAEETLIYLLAHRSREAADASFKSFREDPDWVTARKASEEKAGGSLTARNGVKSLFLTPTDYSPTR